MRSAIRSENPMRGERRRLKRAIIERNRRLALAALRGQDPRAAALQHLAPSLTDRDADLALLFADVIGLKIEITDEPDAP